MSTPRNHYVWKAPPETGINAAPCNAAINVSGTGTSLIDVSGFDRMTLFCFFTRVAATGSIVLKVEGYDETQADYVVLQSVSTDATGLTTLSDNTISKATGSASVKYEIRFKDMNFRRIRISMPSAVTAAGATDVLSVSALLARFG